MWCLKVVVHQGEVLQVVVSHHAVVAGGLDVVYQGVVINFVVSHQVVVAGGLDVKMWCTKV